MKINEAYEIMAQAIRDTKYSNSPVDPQERVQLEFDLYHIYNFIKKYAKQTGSKKED